MTAPESKPGAFNAELKSDDEDDGTMKKSRRFGRGLIRNIGDLSAQSKETAKTSYQQMGGAFDPPDDPGVYETVGVAPAPPPTIGPAAHTQASVADTVATVTVLVAVAVEGVTRFVRHKKGRANG